MRRFQLVRYADLSGVSGTGVVAEGIQFSNGSVALRWRCSWPATAVWDHLDGVIAVHGHSGNTEVHWLDAEPDPSAEPLHGNDPRDVASSVGTWWDTHDDPTMDKPAPSGAPEPGPAPQHHLPSTAPVPPSGNTDHRHG